MSLVPGARYAKVLAIAAAAVGLAGSGALVEHWRLGKSIAEGKLARQTVLTERQQKAMTDALEATLRMHAQLQAARWQNAKLAAAVPAEAPKAPEFACRDTPLPETYLEVFRQ